MAAPLRFLGPIIIANSVNKAQYGILGGFKRYKIIATNNVCAALSMLFFSFIFTNFWGLWGALIALLTSQVINSGLNFYSLQKIRRNLMGQQNEHQAKTLIGFSFPIALQEFSYTLTHWGGSLLIVKFSSMGQLGIFTAASQWQSIVLMIPSLLVNVILSHLSSTTNNSTRQLSLIKRLLSINFISTLLPFIFIYIVAQFISSMYGQSFIGMSKVLRVLVFSSIFMCCSNVFNSAMISMGKNWSLFAARMIRDVFLLGLTYYLIHFHDNNSAALDYAFASVATSVMYFVIVGVLLYREIHKNVRK